MSKKEDDHLPTHPLDFTPTDFTQHPPNQNNKKLHRFKQLQDSLSHIRRGLVVLILFSTIGLVGIGQYIVNQRQTLQNRASTNEASAEVATLTTTITSQTSILQSDLTKYQQYNRDIASINQKINSILNGGGSSGSGTQPIDPDPNVQGVTFDATSPSDDDVTIDTDGEVYGAFIAQLQAQSQSTPSQTDICKADITRDGYVNLSDMSIISQHYLQTCRFYRTPQEVASCTTADLTTDGIVNAEDMALVSKTWGMICQDRINNGTPSPTSSPNPSPSVTPTPPPQTQNTVPPQESLEQLQTKLRQLQRQRTLHVKAMEEKAKQREDNLLKLLEKDVNAFLTTATLADSRNRYPLAVRKRLEEQYSGRGTIETIMKEKFTEAGVDINKQYSFIPEGKREDINEHLVAYLTDSNLSQFPKFNVLNIEGIKLERRLAFRTEEISNTNTNDIPDNLKQLEINQRGLVNGHRKILAVPVKFIQDPTPLVERDDLINIMMNDDMNNVKDYLLDISHGRIPDIEVRVADYVTIDRENVPNDIPDNTESGKCDMYEQSTWRDRITQQLINNGEINSSLYEYDHVILLLPESSHCWWFAPALSVLTFGGTPTYYTDYVNAITHELTHNLGIIHSNHLICNGESNFCSYPFDYSVGRLPQPVNNEDKRCHYRYLTNREDCKIVEYGNILNNMGSNYGHQFPLHIDSGQKRNLGFKDNFISLGPWNVNQSLIEFIIPSNSHTIDNLSNVRIYKPDTDDWYYLTFRTKHGYDQYFPQAGIEITAQKIGDYYYDYIHISPDGDDEPGVLNNSPRKTFHDYINGIKFSQIYKHTDRAKVRIEFDNLQSYKNGTSCTSSLDMWTVQCSTGYFASTNLDSVKSFYNYNRQAWRNEVCDTAVVANPSGGCDNGVSIGQTACAQDISDYQFRCIRGGEDSQKWLAEKCAPGHTCQTSPLGVGHDGCTQLACFTTDLNLGTNTEYTTSDPSTFTPPVYAPAPPSPSLTPSPTPTPSNIPPSPTPTSTCTPQPPTITNLQPGSHNYTTSNQASLAFQIQSFGEDCEADTTNNSYEILVKPSNQSYFSSLGTRLVSSETIRTFTESYTIQAGQTSLQWKVFATNNRTGGTAYETTSPVKTTVLQNVPPAPTPPVALPTISGCSISPPNVIFDSPDNNVAINADNQSSIRLKGKVNTWGDACVGTAAQRSVWIEVRNNPGDSQYAKLCERTGSASSFSEEYMHECILETLQSTYQSYWRVCANNNVRNTSTTLGTACTGTRSFRVSSSQNNPAPTPGSTCSAAQPIIHAITPSNNSTYRYSSPQTTIDLGFEIQLNTCQNTASYSVAMTRAAGNGTPANYPQSNLSCPPGGLYGYCQVAGTPDGRCLYPCQLTIVNPGTQTDTYTLQLNLSNEAYSGGNARSEQTTFFVNTTGQTPANLSTPTQRQQNVLQTLLNRISRFLAR